MCIRPRSCRTVRWLGRWKHFSQAWWPGFETWNPHGGKREQIRMLSLTFIHAPWHVCYSRMHAHSKSRNKLISKYTFKKLNRRPPRISSTRWLSYLYCKASLSAVALDSYFPTSMLILSALLLHSSRVMVRRSFWDLRCSMRLQRKRHWFHAAGLWSDMFLVPLARRPDSHVKKTWQGEGQQIQCLPCEHEGLCRPRTGMAVCVNKSSDGGMGGSKVKQLPKDCWPASLANWWTRGLLRGPHLKNSGEEE